MVKDNNVMAQEKGKKSNRLTPLAKTDN